MLHSFIIQSFTFLFVAWIVTEIILGSWGLLINVLKRLSGLRDAKVLSYINSERGNL